MCDSAAFEDGDSGQRRAPRTRPPSIDPLASRTVDAIEGRKPRGEAEMERFRQASVMGIPTFRQQ